MEAVPSPSPSPSSQERAWALLCHVSGFIGFFLPFGNVTG
jgi:uncharacterized Tic20 family protein